MGEENSISETQGIENIPIVTTNGKIIPVSSLSDIVYTTGPTQIIHIEGERAVTLQIKPADNIALEEAIKVVCDTWSKSYAYDEFYNLTATLREVFES